MVGICEAIGAPGHTQGSVMFRLACKARHGKWPGQLASRNTAKAQPSETDIERAFPEIQVFPGFRTFSASKPSVKGHAEY